MALEPRYCDIKKDVDCAAMPEDPSKEVLVICKICYNGSEDEPLLSPCNCSGSIKYVHQSCLMKWLKARKPVCELCNYKYIILKKAKSYDQRQKPCITRWHVLSIIKAIVVLDWFHFLETVFLCFSLCIINHLNSTDLVYQVSLIGSIELFYYLANFFNCFFLLYYIKWSELNQDVMFIDSHDTSMLNDGRGIILQFIDKYASLLSEYRRITDVVSKVE